ncbi:MAG: hypothetical protein KDB60_16095 [Propionibacteriaceae bacterium]|nr:hypothetical protein [Propionibacteriaceae bacterium]
MPRPVPARRPCCRRRARPAAGAWCLGGGGLRRRRDPGALRLAATRTSSPPPQIDHLLARDLDADGCTDLAYRTYAAPGLNHVCLVFGSASGLDPDSEYTIDPPDVDSGFGGLAFVETIRDGGATWRGSWSARRGPGPAARLVAGAREHRVVRRPAHVRHRRTLSEPVRTGR